MEVMTTSLLSLLSFLILLSVSWKSSRPSPQESFLKCLITNHTLSSHPISQAIFTPQNSTYPLVLQSYMRNLRFNTSSTPKPFLILTPSHESHVQTAVLCAKKHGLQMKIRSGGHDYEGTSYASRGDPFFLLDMFNLRSIDVNIEDETAWVQAGATLGELYYRIAEKSKIHGFPGGICPTVGVGGHVSGGGYGNMIRKYGLTIDQVLDARLVDVNGRVLDRNSMGEDLFWAIRGAGSSFGVITAYKVKLVRVPETVTVFQVERTLEQNATDIVYQWQLVSPRIHEDLFIRLLLHVVKKEDDSGEKKKTIRATFVGMFLGGQERLLSIMNQDFPELGLQKSDCIEMSWTQSVLFWAEFPLGTPDEVLLHRMPPSYIFLKRKSDYVRNPIPKDGWEWLWKKMMELEHPAMYLNPYGGRMSEIPETEVALPHRAGNLFKIQYQGNWKEEGEEAANMHLNLTQKLYKYMTRFASKNPRQAFFNYKDLDLGINSHGKNSFEEGRAYGVKYFKGNFHRLVQVKSKVDPDNFFRHEQSIPTFA